MEWFIAKIINGLSWFAWKDSRSYVWGEKRMKHFGKLWGNGEFDANRWIVYASVLLVFHCQSLKFIHSFSKYLPFWITIITQPDLHNTPQLHGCVHHERIENVFIVSLRHNDVARPSNVVSASDSRHKLNRTVDCSPPRRIKWIGIINMEEGVELFELSPRLCVCWSVQFKLILKYFVYDFCK